MSSIKNVLVVGAGGNLGPIVVKHLTAANFNVSILTRDNSTTTSSPEVKVYRTDYSKPSLVEACKGQDAVISTIGVFGKSSQTNVIDAAIEAGVKRFIPSDFAYKTYDMSELERVVPLIHQRLQPNKVVLDYLKDVSARNPDFTWTAIGGGSLFDWTLKTGFLGTSLSNHTSTIIDSGNESYLTTTIAQLARTIVSTLQNPTKTANKYLTVSSFVTTQNEVLDTAEKVTGQKFEVKRVGAKEWREEGAKMLESGDFRGLGRLWGYFFWRDGKGGIHGGDEDNEMLGLPKESMEDVMRGVAGL